MKFILEEEKLDEKLPKDLAKAYNRSDFSRFSDRDYRKHDRVGNWYDKTDVDYEAAEYNEITPEQATEIAKSGRVDTLRFLIDGDLTAYNADKKCIVGADVDYWGDKKYSTKTGKSITDTRRMPFSYVCKIADKIYVTDEDATQIDSDKLSRRDVKRFGGDKGYWYSHGTTVYANGQDRYAGRHRDKNRTDWDKRDRDYALDRAKNARVQLKKLEIDWEAGNISRNDYEEMKATLLNKIEDSRNDAYKAIGNIKDKKARDRYEYATAASRDAIDKYRTLKSEIERGEGRVKSAEDKVITLKNSGVASKDYDYYRTQLADYKRKLEYAKEQIAYYEKQLSDDKVNKDTAEAEAELAKHIDELTANRAELDKLMRRTPKTEAVEDKAQLVVNPVMADAIKDQEVAEEKKEKATEITKDGTPKLESFRLSLNEDWFDDYETKVEPDGFDLVYAEIPSDPQIQKAYEETNDVLGDFYDAVEAIYPDAEFVGFD